MPAPVLAVVLSDNWGGRSVFGGLDWTYFSPAGVIAPGERTGTFRLGGDQLITDAEGKSTISCEDYAVALLDEVETPQRIRQRFTIGYYSIPK